MTKIITILAITTFYGEAHQGKEMADGNPFDMEALTCATYLWPLHTNLEVEYEGKKVFVEITDRCDDKTELDLSKGAFRFICDPDVGRIKAKVTFRYEDQTDSWKKKYGPPQEIKAINTFSFY